MSNKNCPSITRTNLIGRTIFLTSEKISYDQSQAADGIFLLVKKMASVFPPFRKASQANGE